MSHIDSAIYSAYGAYELKAKYQRNFLFGTISVTAFVFALLAVFWIIGKFGEEGAINTAPVVIRTVAELGPPPTVAKKPPQVKVKQPNVQAPKVGIPKPVADEEVLDDDVMLATRDEMAEIVAPDISAESGDDIIVDIADDDYLPGFDEFVPVEIIAEMIYQEKPKYPDMARQIGLTGTVWISVLVGKDGNVKDQRVFKSSGTKSLDLAALEAAPKNKFKPAIQNGRPVPMWVTYKMEFKFNE